MVEAKFYGNPSNSRYFIQDQSRRPTDAVTDCKQDKKHLINGKTSHCVIAPTKGKLSKLTYTHCAFSHWTHKEWMLLNIFFIMQFVL